ncbi:hypothetical protein ADH76_31600 [Enterocloster clostridioformis]|uniref:hypothetical protein n=1 Tax=Enterocloster clostridioformis TaxID=1531 RepID=UPI00080C47AE|nr:hypothetical protein [Enterocloster clostridioformis]ANU46793.1 hypothetical protein A4V08_14220 [Lachnoclostridium sp. YL32]NDO26864.1 hypothetical protein [Enterocloster clostridioformis]OXE62384.1 hypothetical protein ADH76_31600 [Enterocloster clostridioformis]QQQ98502.1 hypothetical protein I5Q83_20380 [Enterocloster clostridioformis]
MEIEIACMLKMETDVPILQPEGFRFFWKPDCHAALKLKGYADRTARWDPAKSYNSRIKLWLDDGRKKQILTMVISLR